MTGVPPPGVADALPVAAALLAAAAALLAAAAVLLVPGRRRQPGRRRRSGRRRLARVLPLPARPGRLRERAAALAAGRTPYLGAAIAGVAVALVVGGWPGLVAGALSGVGAGRVLRRLEPRVVREVREAAERDLPLALDLLEACLRSGQPPTAAAAMVGEAIGGPLGDRLATIARAGALGAPPAEAWARLAEVAGGAAVARRITRASESGTELAAALAGLAADLRAQRTTAGEEAVRRTGVLVVLPLGLCFLPAFICVGVVPLVLGILRTVLR